MKTIETKLLTGIVENNSCDYISKVFHELNSGCCFSSIAKGKDIAGLKLEFSNIVETADTRGWYSGVEYKPSDDPQVGQMAFSSGTEGKVKCIKISHSALANTTNRLISVMEMTDEIREYVGIPVYHSFGLGRCRAVSAVGGKFYIPQDGFSILELASLIKENKINAISAVPSLWKILILQRDRFIHEGEKIRWIEIGSQYMSAEEKVALKEIFPNAIIVQHYGLTEASRTTFLEIHKTEGRVLESVGQPLFGVAVKVNENGLIMVKGDHVSESMITVDAGEVPLQDSDGWFTTSDIGHFEEGYLFFDGRNDDQINCGGVKVYPEHIESKVKKMVEILNGWVVVGVTDSIRGQIPLLVVDSATRDKEKELLENISIVLKEMNLNIGDALKSYSVDTISVTSTGKIKRKEIVRNYENQRCDEVPVPDANTTDTVPKCLKPLLNLFGVGRAKSVQDVFKSKFQNQKIEPEDTFVDLGGDSLSYLATAIDLERVIPNLPTDWHKLPVKDLEKLSGDKSKILVKMDSSIFLRAFSIILVVMGHFDFFEYGGGGAYTLFFIAGMNFATFTIPKTILDESSRPALLLILRVAALSFVVFMMNFIITGYGELPAALFYSNWLDPNTEGATWFIEVYLQMMILLSVVLMVPWCRTALSRNAFLTSVLFTVLMLGIAILCDTFFDTNHLYRRLPHLLAWIFLCGISLNFAKNAIHRALVTVIFLVAWLLFFNASVYYFGLAGLLLIWAPSLPIPRLISSATKEIANASLVIYLTHFQFGSISEKLIGPNIGCRVLFALVGGVLVWKLYISLDIFICNRFSTAKKGSADSGAGELS